MRSKPPNFDRTLKFYAHLLKDPSQRSSALSALVESKNERAVALIIDPVACVRGVGIDAARALTRLTGQNLSIGEEKSSFPGALEELVARHQNETRQQWLRSGVMQPNKVLDGGGAFVAAQELARLGDDSVVPLVLRDMAPGSRH